MSDLKMISPLLDSMTVENETAGHNGRTCYTVRNVTTGERFILKRMSVPASDNQVNALILSGAYSDEAAVNEYYSRVVEDIKAELAVGKKLAASGNFSGAVDYQVERKESGVGFDIYILYPLYIPLNDLIANGAMTNLRAINLGLDMCDAISACREAGYLFGNIKPENIYFMQSGKFVLGDLGLVTLQDLKYACLPEEYIGRYSAPELSDISASPNTTVDLYSLGMVLFRIYNGNHGPFEDEETSELMADKLRLTGKPIPTPIYADYELASIILRACAFKPEDRFQTPEEFKQTLMLYMQRNEVSDTLIVPPIVATQAPISEDAETEAAEEPIRMTDAEDLDEDFRKSFAPDLSGAGTEKDIDPEVVPVVVPVDVQPVSAEDVSEEASKQDSAEVSEEASVEAAPEEAAAEESNDAEEVDPSQIDLDELLASVEEVVGTAPSDHTEEEAAPLSMHIEKAPIPADKYVDPAPEQPEEAPKKKVGPLVGKIITIVLLLAAIGAAIYFLLTWYFVDVQELRVDSCTIEEAVISLTSEDELSKFVLSCSDNYGSSCPVTVVDGKYVVTGLQPETGYIVTVSAADYHALTSASTYTLNFTTPESTDISEFTAVRGEEDGQALLSFTFEGPQPDEWIITYSNAAGDDTNEIRLTETTYTISDLKLNDSYTFTLSASEGFFLTGALSAQYEVVPIVEAKDLNVSEINDNRITVTWAPGENLPEEWTVTCEAEGMDMLTETTKQTACSFALDSFDKDYTITVAARGMVEPEVLVLPADPIVVNNLKATTNEDGSVTIAWDTPVAVPAGGWYVSYNTTGSHHDAYMLNIGEDTENGNSAVLTNLIPNTQYDVSLSMIADNTDQKIFGITTLSFTTDKSGALEEFNLSPDAPLTAENENIALYTLPEGEDWDYSDLDDAKDSFAPDEKIAVCIEVDSVSTSGEDVILTYAIRDSKGNVVNDVSTTLEWSDMWYNRRHASAIPLPGGNGNNSASGRYTLEVYVNGRLLASVAFAIS